MIGRTLGIYFALRFFKSVGWFVLALLALIIVVDYTQLSDRLSGLPGYTNSLAFQIAVLKSPGLFQEILPFIVLFSSMAVLVQLNRKYELVIARAAGLSAWQFLFPLSGAAFAVGVVSVLAINPLAAKTYEMAETLQANLIEKRTGASPALTIPWIRQNGPDFDVVIGAKSVVQGGAVLTSPVFIIIDKEGKAIRRIDGRRATLSNQEWLIIDATETTSASQRKQLPLVKLPTTLTPDLIQERLQRPETIPFFELSNKIEIARALGYPADAFAMQFHSVLAMPALLMVMTLIASTVTLKFVRFGQSAGMILGGILAGFMLYVVTVLVKAFGGAGLVPPVVAAWFPVLLAFLIGVSFLLHTEDG